MMQFNEQLDNDKLDGFGKYYEFQGEPAKSSKQVEWAQIYNIIKVWLFYKNTLQSTFKY